MRLLKTRSLGKLLLTPASYNAAVDCRRAVPYGAQGGGVAEGGGVARRRTLEFPRTICRRFAFLWPVSSQLGPREPEDWGLGVVMGGGAGAAGFPRTFRKPPCGGGRAPSRGPGSRREGVEARFRRPTLPPAAGQLGARSKAGRTGSLNFPSVCWEGNAPRRSGSDFTLRALASRPTSLAPLP